jgi:hypothetical protein
MSWKKILKARDTKTEKELTDYFNNLSVEEMKNFYDNPPKSILGYRLKKIEQQTEDEGMLYFLYFAIYGYDIGKVFVSDDGTVDSEFEIEEFRFWSPEEYLSP